jgi:hypothetical protein
MSRTPKDAKSSLPRWTGDPDLVPGPLHTWEREYERVELVRGVAL